MRIVKIDFIAEAQSYCFEKQHRIKALHLLFSPESTKENTKK